MLDFKKEPKILKVLLFPLKALAFTLFAFACHLTLLLALDFKGSQKIARLWYDNLLLETKKVFL